MPTAAQTRKCDLGVSSEAVKAGPAAADVTVPATVAAAGEVSESSARPTVAEVALSDGVRNATVRRRRIRSATTCVIGCSEVIGAESANVGDGTFSTLEASGIKIRMNIVIRNRSVTSPIATFGS